MNCDLTSTDILTERTTKSNNKNRKEVKNMENSHISTQETAKRLGVTPWTVCKYYRNGKLKGFCLATKLGLQIEEESVRRLISENSNTKKIRT